MSESLAIKSHKGTYVATFGDEALERLDQAPPKDAHFIIDRRVADLWRDRLANVLAGPSVLLIDATERAKSLDQFPLYVEHLVARGIRRDHVLVAIGGGITQDITCFLAATLLRGINWQFFPTTLLAQADSCIGSKSSINCGDAKNILGTFTPPRQVNISPRLLSTLDPVDVRSGVGEIIKAHVIDGPASFDALAASYDALFDDPDEMLRFVRSSLAIKQRFIEADEFDQGIRNVFNYGHSFGHAIEAATDFAVPHGIAVTIGMDMANWVSAQMGVGDLSHFHRMHRVLARNYRGFEVIPVPEDRFLAAIGKDKKNSGAGSITLILPGRDGRVFRDAYANDARFADLCHAYLTGIRA